MTQDIDRLELADLLAEVAIEGNEQYKANAHDNADRPYRRGIGSGMTKAAKEIAEYYDLNLYDAENRDLRTDNAHESA